jgi:hypothetical protein
MGSNEEEDLVWMWQRLTWLVNLLDLDDQERHPTPQTQHESPRRYTGRDCTFLGESATEKHRWSAVQIG